LQVLSAYRTTTCVLNPLSFNSLSVLCRCHITVYSCIFKFLPTSVKQWNRKMKSLCWLATCFELAVLFSVLKD
jgi:hypothetical protein